MLNCSCHLFGCDREADARYGEFDQTCGSHTREIPSRRTASLIASRRKLILIDMVLQKGKTDGERSFERIKDASGYQYFIHVAMRPEVWHPSIPTIVAHRIPYILSLIREDRTLSDIHFATLFVNADINSSFTAFRKDHFLCSIQSSTQKCVICKRLRPRMFMCFTHRSFICSNHRTHI